LQSLSNLFATSHFDVLDDLQPLAAGRFSYMGPDPRSGNLFVRRLFSPKTPTMNATLIKTARK